MRRFYLLSVLLFCLLFMKPASVRAADYKSDYTIQYFVQQQNNRITTSVEFTIKITNLRSDVYVNKFSISFPQSFTIHNLTARDDSGPVTPDLTSVGRLNTITAEFSKPNMGRDTTNTFYLRFNQDNLFQIQGNVWEVILPTIENRTDSNYTAIIHLPQNTDKKISIAKPNPTSIEGDTITWVNPQTKTIYAVFGNVQYYNLNLTYHIENPKIIPVYTEVAFPPDMLHQKVVVAGINPKPIQTYSDSDGNFLGKYVLTPKQSLTIQYRGIAEIFVKPRDDYRKTMERLFIDSKHYLLTQQKYWTLSDVALIANYTTANQIYRFVTKNLHYDYARASTNNVRLGAQTALNNPNQAVCVEFSDLFIASAREKGIYSREIEGYGYSNDNTLRPLSLVSDVLHSWPQFYNTSIDEWQSVDPTWENTSGIDYFSSFDLDHIAFVIHGKRPDYPLTAGMYKLENSHDVSVSFTTAAPQERHDLSITTSSIPSKLLDNGAIEGNIILKNNGNVSEMNTDIRLDSPDLIIEPPSVFVPMIVPYGTDTVPVRITAKIRNRHVDASLAIYAHGVLLSKKSISVIPYTYALSLKISEIVAGLFLIILVVKLILRKYHG